MDLRDLDVSQLPRGRRETGWLNVTSRPDGGDWRLPFLYVTGAKAGPALLVIAGVHGDEYEGVEAIPLVFQAVRPEALRGTLLTVPLCNVPAYETITRSSPLDGLNLARVFPGDPDGSVTQRIAFWVTERLLKRADFLIDLHSGGLTYDIPTLVGYSHGSDDLDRRSLSAARAFGAPVLWGHPPPVPPGRSISAAVDLGVPWLYTEAPGGGTVRPEDLTLYRDGVLRVMQSLGMLEGEPKAQPVTHHLIGSGDLDQVISAPVAGYFRPEVRLLEGVRAGQRLGAILDLFGQVAAEVRADRDGIVIMLRRLRRVQAGDGLAHLTSRLS
jgi:predicted deacylase